MPKTAKKTNGVRDTSTARARRLTKYNNALTKVATFIAESPTTTKDLVKVFGCNMCDLANSQTLLTHFLDAIKYVRAHNNHGACEYCFQCHSRRYCTVPFRLAKEQKANTQLSHEACVNVLKQVDAVVVKRLVVQSLIQKK